MGLEFREIAGWRCCGATAAHQFSPQLATDLPLANLALAARDGYSTVTAPCVACFSRLRPAPAPRAGGRAGSGSPRTPRATSAAHAARGRDRSHPLAGDASATGAARRLLLRLPADAAAGGDGRGPPGESHGDGHPDRGVGG